MKKILKFLYGATRGILRRLSFDLLWHGVLSRDRRIIKMTGIENCETRVCFYPSVLHFLHNVPSLFAKKNMTISLLKIFFTMNSYHVRSRNCFLPSNPLPA